MEDFQLDNETVKQKCLWIYRLFQRRSGTNSNLFTKAARGENVGEKFIKLHTLDQQERMYLLSLSPVMQDDNSFAIFLVMQDFTQFTLQKQNYARSLMG